MTNMRFDEHPSKSDSENSGTEDETKEEKLVHYNKREDSIVIETETEAQPHKNFKTPEATDNNDEDDDDYGGLPIDRGWAWVILLACYANYLVMEGYYRSLGILFVEFLEVLNASVAKTTLVFGVINGVYSISALFSTQVLVAILKVRKTVILGGFLSFLAIFLGMFATDVTYLICTHSVLLGSLRDMTGTYTTCFHYIGTCAYIAAILLFVESCFHASTHLNKLDKKEVEETKPFRIYNKRETGRSE